MSFPKASDAHSRRRTGVGFASHGSPNPSLELDEGVKGGQVKGAARGTRGWVLFDHLLTPDKTSDDAGAPDGAGDGGLDLKVVMPPQYLGGRPWRCSGSSTSMCIASVVPSALRFSLGT